MDTSRQKKLNKLLRIIDSETKGLDESELQKIHEQILKIKEDYLPSLRYLQRKYMEQNEVEKVEKTAEAMLVSRPQDTESIYNLACIYTFSDRYPKALEFFKKLGELDSRHRELQKIETILEELIRGNISAESSLPDDLEKNLKENIENLNSSKNTFFVEKCDSDTLVIAFTGFANKLHMPTKQFFEEAKLTEHSKIIVYDGNFQKTLGGLPPYANSFEEFVEFLKKEIKAISPKKVITVGCSAGGHPALLLGHLLKVDAAFAFSPFPYLNYEKLIAMNDPLQSSPSAHKINELADKAGKYFDLAPILAEWNGKTSYQIHVSKGHEWDVKRASTLEATPHLSIHRHPGYSHAVARKMAQLGLLDSCFSE